VDQVHQEQNEQHGTQENHLPGATFRFAFGNGSGSGSGSGSENSFGSSCARGD